MALDPPARRRDEHLAEAAATVAAAGGDVRKTIRCRFPTPDGVRALPVLLPGVGAAAELELADTLGEGGMGIVYAAMQTSLERTVAVKTPRGDSARVAAQMVREARVTGRLEHPNVVPIHALGQDETGHPLIVMKHIDGRPWSDLLEETSEPRARMSEEFLQRHLSILLQVTQALEFAHDQGVLHRDIKPENVMVGRFGEVYLVDWGLAVGLEGGPPGIPRARDVDHIEGTPVYLAPEMARAAGDRIGVRSDVYLLGATLFEALTGAPPHEAPHIHAVLLAALSGSVPELPPFVPEALAAIVRRALAPEPSDRYESVAAMAEAVRDYLVRRGSMQLADEGGARAEELQAQAAEGVALGPALRGLFHEARFAFDQASRLWPDNEDARRGRRRVLTLMVDLELSQGTATAAQSILDTLENPPADLAERVGDAARKEHREQTRLRAIARDANFAVGARARQIGTAVSAFAWTATCFTCGYLDRSGVLPIGHVAFGVINALITLLILGSTRGARELFMTTKVSRQVNSQMMVLFGMGAVLWPLLGSLGLSMPQTTVVASVVAAGLWTSAVISIGFPWVPQVIGQLLIAALAWHWPARHFEIYGVIGGFQTLLVAHLLGRQGEESPLAGC